MHVSPGRRLASWAVVCAAGVGVWLALRPAASALGPVAVVAAFEEALEAEDYARAHALVDYRARLSEALGALYAAGSEADRAALVQRTEAMLVDTSRKQWPGCCAGKTMTREPSAGPRTQVARADDEVAWVASRPASASGEAGFRWEYRLHRKEGAWRIMQREFTRDGILSDSTRFWSMARKAVANRLGREPTLGELAANLEAVRDDLRVRTFKVPPRSVLEGKPPPAAKSPGHP